MKILRQLETQGGLSTYDDRLDPGIESTRTFYSAVVIDFISNPDEYLGLQAKNEEDGINNRTSLKSGVNKVSNSKFVDKMPRNSLIGVIVSDRGSRGLKPQIIYPFFSQHMSTPVKPGEQVWIIYEHSGERGSLGYWLTRKATDNHVDDLNYTHQDRVTLGLERSEAPDDSDFNSFSFPLGGFRSKESNTLLGEDPYTEILENSDAYTNQHVNEPVPRFSKRAGDYVIQGSNNTLIVLGEDRLGGIGTTSEKGKGTIDVVAGRGVLLKDSTIFDETDTVSIDNSENPTAPAGLGKNTRGSIEIDKSPLLSDNSKESNKSEGDPDYINDLSRVYISMKTDGDKNFAIDSESEALPTAFDTSIDDADQDAYVLFKSNQIRVIARKSEDHDINGSIRIVKEGDRGEDLAAIVILPDGTIQISGKKIFIGRHTDDGGKGSEEGDTDGDPYMRFSEFKKYMNDTLDAIDGKFKSIGNDVKNLAGALNQGNVTPGYGGSNPALIKAAAQYSAALAELDADVGVSGQKDTTMDSIKSERIFGE